MTRFQVYRYPVNKKVDQIGFAEVLMKTGGSFYRFVRKTDKTTDNRYTRNFKTSPEF